MESALLSSTGQLVRLVFVFYIITRSKKERFSQNTVNSLFITKRGKFISLYFHLLTSYL